MIVSQLMEINFEDEIKALILMSYLPTSWNTIVVGSTVLDDLKKLKFDEI